MAGYTPVFDTVFQGTLCGRWPSLPVWLTILPMADKNGRIDMTPEAISAITGWPIAILLEGIQQLCQPDPRSRSKAEQGARLKLLDPDRDWGWQVINHAKYREKARLLARDTQRTESGVDAQRKRGSVASPPLSPEVPRSPPKSPSQTQTHTQTQTQTKALKSARETEIRDWITRIREVYPKAARQDWITAEKLLRGLVNDGEQWDEILEGVRRYRTLCDATNRQAQNPGMFFQAVDRPWAQEWPLPQSKAERRLDANIDVMRQFVGANNG